VTIYAGLSAVFHSFCKQAISLKSPPSGCCHDVHEREFPTNGRRATPNASVDGLFIRLQRVFAQTEASMKKSSTALICSVEILKQAQQGGTIETRQIGLYVSPGRL